MRSEANTPRRRRTLFHVLVVAGIFVLVLLVGLGVVFMNASTIATKVKDRVLPQVSSRLGREVRAGNVHLDLWPPISVGIDQIVVEGGPGEPPIVQAATASTHVQLWPLVKSRGQDIQIDSATLKAPEINLVRRADGHWNYEDLTQGQSQPSTQPTQPPSEREIAVSEFSVVDGQIRVIDQAGMKQSAKDATTVGVTQLDITARNLTPGEESSLTVDAALASSKKNMHATLSINPLPETAVELKNAYPKLRGDFALDSVALAKLEGFLPPQIAQLITGGAVSTKVALTTNENGTYAIKGGANVKDLRVRGTPSSGEFKLVASVDPKKPNSMTAQIKDIAIQGPGMDLSGEVTYAAASDRIRYALQSQHLDLDTLLGLMPPSPEKEPGAPLVPPSMRATVKELDVAGTVGVKEIKSGKLTANNLNADTKLSKGVLSVSKGSVELYSGKATLDGTSVNLAAAKPEWDLKAKVEALNLSGAMTALTGASPVSGLVNGALEMKGAGNDWDQLRSNITGNGLLALANGALTSADLTAKIAQPLSMALQQFGQANPGTKLPLSGTTQLKDLTANFSVQDGWIRFKAPLTVNTPFGSMALNGRVGLDQKLDLEGKAALSKEFLTSVSGGKFQPKSSVDLPLDIAGSLKDPTIAGVDWNQFAKTAVTQGLQQQMQDQQKQLENQAQEKLKGFLRGL